ncbi:MAG: Squalene--hopene cyclase [candidate division WS6 bacterium OLB20]|uniref:Squalene--hopene cyclase n=1 Tax=candidate division WS6 bacterium OLB20 TaxID=1617426 RepID=A0A136LYP2_9BACT|nr:MAG: Squalene--hopene cyclase [candidate division WS6 bacterium OLB20]
MMNIENELDAARKNALRYIITTQKKDGSWSGPYSSRLRETVLANLIAKIAGWKEISQATETWINEHPEPFGVSELELALNTALLDILRRKSLLIPHEQFMQRDLVRKYLMIYAIGILLNINFPTDTQQLVAKILTRIEEELKANTTLKPWARSEFLSFLIICCDRDDLIEELLKLEGDSGSWFNNTATTAIALLSISRHQRIQFNSYYQFFKENMQQDGGYSYAPIENWDTGLTLQILAEQPDQDDIISKAISYLELSQNPDGGWGFTKATPSESDTTSIVVRALQILGEDRLKSKALNFLKSVQFTTGEYKGLWPVWDQSEMPSIEVVAHVAEVFSHEGFDVSHAVSWLTNKVLTDSWMPVWGRSSAYAASAILATIGNKRARSIICKHILSTQLKDGGWPSVHGESSNASATGNALAALRLLDSPEQKIKRSGMEYLIRNQLENGTWPEVREVVGPRPYSYSDQMSTHYFALNPLLL